MGSAEAASIGYEWEASDGSARMTPALLLTFGGTEQVRGLSLEASGPYPIRVRSVVFVKPRESQLSSTEDAALRPTGRAGERILREDWLRDFGDASFYIFRERRLTAGPQDQGRAALGLSSEIARQLESERIVLGRNRLVREGDSHEAYLSLDSEIWGDAVLAISLPDPDRVGLQRNLFRISLGVGGLAFVLLLVFAAELFWAYFSLRWQLAGLFLVTGALPLALLAVFLVGLMEGEQRQQDEERVVAALQRLQERIDEERSALETGAQSLLQSLAATWRGSSTAEDRAALLERLRTNLALARPRDWHPESFCRPPVAASRRIGASGAHLRYGAQSRAGRSTSWRRLGPLHALGSPRAGRPGRDRHRRAERAPRLLGPRPQRRLDQRGDRRRRGAGLRPEWQRSRLRGGRVPAGARLGRRGSATRVGGSAPDESGPPGPSLRRALAALWSLPAAARSNGQEHRHARGHPPLAAGRVDGLCGCRAGPALLRRHRRPAAPRQPLLGLVADRAGLSTDRTSRGHGAADRRGRTGDPGPAAARAGRDRQLESSLRADDGPAP
jgi:hypothetical protein